MEPLLAFVGSWWWIAPAAATAGATGYGALTAGKRRARRLEVDAARHEEQLAYRNLAIARTQVRAAQAEVLKARAAGGSPLGSQEVWEARRRLQSAKQAAKAASLALRASRANVKATTARHRLSSPGAPLPIETLMAAHDAVTARWLAYETDAAKALEYPQMLDAQHPTTLAFLRAQQEALQLRPSSGRDKISPAHFVAYREAVRAAEAAFTAAESDAARSARSGARSSFSRATFDRLSRPRGEDEVTEGPKGGTGAPASAVWPVPAWKDRRPST